MCQGCDTAADETCQMNGKLRHFTFVHPKTGTPVTTEPIFKDGHIVREGIRVLVEGQPAQEVSYEAFIRQMTEIGVPLVADCNAQVLLERQFKPTKVCANECCKMIEVETCIIITCPQATRTLEVEHGRRLWNANTCSCGHTVKLIENIPTK